MYYHAKVWWYFYNISNIVKNTAVQRMQLYFSHSTAMYNYYLVVLEKYFERIQN